MTRASFGGKRGVCCPDTRILRRRVYGRRVFFTEKENVVTVVSIVLFRLNLLQAAIVRPIARETDALKKSMTDYIRELMTNETLDSINSRLDLTIPSGLRKLNVRAVINLSSRL